MKKTFIPLVSCIICMGASAQPKAVLSDDFSSNKNNWATGKIDKLEAKVENGRYIIDNRMNTSFNPQVMAGVDSTKDYEISVNIKTIKHDVLSFSGLIFGSNKYHYYSFAVNTADEYLLYEVNGNDFIEIAHAKLANVLTAINVTNKLKLTKAGKEWKLFINDSLVNRVPSKRLYGPFAGVYSENIKAEYDDFTITGTPIVTSGSVADLFPLIYQSARNNFEFVKGGQTKYDTSAFYLSTPPKEDEFARVDLGKYKNRFFCLLKSSHPTKALAIKYTDSLAAAMRKAYPAYTITKMLDKNGLPAYTIKEIAAVKGKQPVAKIEVTNREDFATILTIEADPVAQATTAARLPAKPATNTQQAIKPVGGWIINDDFDNNNYRWFIDSTAGYQYKINGGQYVLDEKTSSQGTLTNTFALDDAHDYKIETEIANAFGKNEAFGLVFGGDDAYKYYFKISNDGYYSIYQAKGDTAIANVIKSYTHTNAIHFGAGLSNKSNRLTIIKLKDKWSFRINDEWVFSCKALPFTGRKFGFSVPAKTTLFAYTFKIYDWTLAETAGQPLEAYRDNVFFDDFNANKNDWGELDDEDVKTNFDGYDYIIEYKQPKGYYMPRVRVPMANDEDMRMELGTSHRAGDTTSPYGLCFASTDVQNANLFLIAANGTFSVGKYEDDKWVALNDWSATDAIRLGDYSYNYLVFEQAKGKWNFYINDKLVYSCASDRLFGERMGCYVTGKQKVAFNRAIIDRIKYRE